MPILVEKALQPTLEVNEKLQKFLSANKLRQKYLVSDFADLIIDRTWGEISDGQNN